MTVTACWPTGAHACAVGPLVAAVAEAGRSPANTRAVTSERRVIAVLTKAATRRCRFPGVKLRIALITAAFALVSATGASADPAQYVRPLAGTLGSGFPMVGASVPFGQIQPGPDTALADGSDDPVNYCGYGFQDPTIKGFSFTHFDGAGIKIAGDLPFMPTTGAPSFDAQANASPYEHATEVAEPGYYSVQPAEDATRVELTAALRASIARITFPQTAQANVIVDPTRSIGGAATGHTDITGDRSLSGWTLSPDNYTVHFAIRFDRAFSGHTASGAATALTFDTTKDQVVTMRVAISYVDAAGAEGNLAADAPPK